MKVSIMQPTFVPWLGWFDLADQSDKMVLLDDVAFSKQSWQQRNQIRTQNGLQYLSVPVKTAGRLGQKIADCETVDSSFVVKMNKTIAANYSKARYFDANYGELATTLSKAVSTNRLVEINCSLISWMAKKLEITTPMIRATTLGVGGERGEHVAAICQSLGADQYLSPAGAESYLIEDKPAFDRRGIMTFIHVYEHPEYTQQFKPFMPFASALDLILNLGPAAGEVMRKGRRPMRPIG